MRGPPDRCPARSSGARRQQQDRGRERRRADGRRRDDRTIADEEKGTDHQRRGVPQHQSARAGERRRARSRSTRRMRRPSSAAIHTTPAAPRVSANPAAHASADTMNSAAARAPTNAETRPGCRGRSPHPRGRSIRRRPGAIDTIQCHTTARVRSRRAGEQRIEMPAPGPDEESARRQEHLDEEQHAQARVELARADARGPDRSRQSPPESPARTADAGRTRAKNRAERGTLMGSPPRPCRRRSARARGRPRRGESVERAPTDDRTPSGSPRGPYRASIQPPGRSARRQAPCRCSAPRARRLDRRYASRTGRGGFSAVSRTSGGNDIEARQLDPRVTRPPASISETAASSGNQHGRSAARLPPHDTMFSAATEARARCRTCRVVISLHGSGCSIAGTSRLQRRRRRREIRLLVDQPIAAREQTECGVGSGSPWLTGRPISIRDDRASAP